METQCRSDYAQKRYRNAKLCRRANALWKTVSGRRCGAHRSSHGREGTQPGDARCLASVAGFDSPLRVWWPGTIGPLFRGLFTASMASAAFFVVDDFNVASARHGQSFRLPKAARRTGICDELDCGNDKFG